MKPDGVIVPIVTPVNESGQIDRPGLERLINHLIQGGIRNIFPAGTTGEFARLQSAVRHELFDLTVQYCRGRARVYAGVSDTSLDEVLNHLHVAEDCAVDACVISLPYYYPTSIAEAQRWFTAITKASVLPVVLYNIPGNIGQILPPQVVAALKGKIVGIKDSGGDAHLMQAYFRSLGGDHRNASFLVGSEKDVGKAIIMGADGVVPSMANVFPGLWSRLWICRHNHTILARTMKLVNRINQLNTYDGLPLSSILWKKRLLNLEGICSANAVYPAETLGPQLDEQLRKVSRMVQEFISRLDRGESHTDARFVR